MHDPLELDRATVRALERHETEAHAIGDREVVDLGDGLLLVDRRDPDPFWNRLVSVRWPADARGFDRRLAEIVTLFAARGRRPHIWPTAVGDEPPDLVARLIVHGFVDTGAGLLMACRVHEEPVRPARPDAADAPGRGDDLAIEVLEDAVDRAAIVDAARVLAEAFTAHGESDRSTDTRTAAEIEATAAVAADDLARSLDDERVVLVVARIAGEAAAVAKVTGGGRFAYLASIGTRPAFRGRGLGGLVTRAAVREGARLGAEIAYLGVFDGNAGARRLYERLGFRVVGGPVPDLLLVDPA